MNTFLFSFVISLLLSTAFTVLLIYSGFGRFFTREDPSLRDAHIKEIPRSGGIGITIGFLATIVLAYGLVGGVPNAPDNPLSIGIKDPLFIFLIGGFGIFLVGLSDDLWNIRIRYKLLGQFLVAVLVSWFGLDVRYIELPVYGIQALGAFAFPLTVFWMVGVMNAINLIDGLDGLASGIAMIALGGLLAISFIQGNLTIVVFCLALIGGTLGFWLFNKTPASIFMGDSGSLFLGYCLSTLCIWGVMSPDTGAINLLPIVLLAVPILDTLFSFFRRHLKGIPFYSADKDHMHHRLLAKGYTPGQSVMILYLFSAGFTGLTLIVYWEPISYLSVCLAAMMLAYLILFFLEYKEIKSPLQSIRETASLKKQRSFVHALSEHIDIFFEKDTSLDDLIKSFSFWASQMKIEFYSIKVGSHFLAEYKASLSVDEHGYRQLVYEQGILEIILNFRADELDLDSDAKGRLMDQVIEALIKNIHRLYHEVPPERMDYSAPLHRKETTHSISMNSHPKNVN
ncbi:MAG: undecaprenyl/decaprenyl-phosphate alpha-N-acetylglucosaminyl 1-phosphate transferase [SAR324 cluster bacterium]|nr:undecaprenyl/decaprenyl-phosphate alpha-N-acetylglucosaminyl 1-phosphate transferase [SAR324 cluster bacterium]